MVIGHWSTKHAVIGRDCVLAVADNLLAEIDNEEITFCMSRVVKDLVEGELLQTVAFKQRWMTLFLGMRKEPYIIIMVRKLKSHHTEARVLPPLQL